MATKACRFVRTTLLSLQLCPKHCPPFWLYREFVREAEVGSLDDVCVIAAPSELCVTVVDSFPELCFCHALGLNSHLWSVIPCSGHIWVRIGVIKTPRALLGLDSVLGLA